MKKRAAFFFSFVLMLLVPLMFAESSGSENQLKLIPEPKEVSLQQGGFHVRPTTRILVEFGHQAEDRIAAETLAEEIHDQSGLKLDIAGTKAESKQESKQEDGAIVLARLQDKTVREFLESKGLKADSIGDQGYLLSSDNSHFIVDANTCQGLFYVEPPLLQ